MAKDDGAPAKLALTITETSRLLEMDPRTVSHGIKDGTIPSVRVGRRVLVPRAALMAMFEAPAGKAVER